MKRSEHILTTLADLIEALPVFNRDALVHALVEAYERGAATKMKIAVDPNSPHSFVRQRNSQKCAVCQCGSGSPLHASNPELPMKVFALRSTAVRIKGKYMNEPKPWFQIVDAMNGENLSAKLYAANAAWQDALQRLGGE